MIDPAIHIRRAMARLLCTLRDFAQNYRYRTFNDEKGTLMLGAAWRTPMIMAENLGRRGRTNQIWRLQSSRPSEGAEVLDCIDCFIRTSYTRFYSSCAS